MVEIIKSFQSHGATIFVFLSAAEDSEIAQELKHLNIKFRLLPLVSKYTVYKHIWPKFWFFLSYRPDVFIASGQYATFAGIPVAYFFRIKRRVYIRHHSNYHHEFDHKSGLAADKFMNHLATKIVAVSEVVKNILVVKEGVPLEKIVLIHNGIHIDKFSNREGSENDPRQHLAYNDGLRIGVISRLTMLKGVEYTAIAFKEFLNFEPSATLSIIGEFSDSYDKICEILKNVPQDSFSIISSHPDIPMFFRSLDVFVHVPISAEIESFGLVYIEALASGVPCIFSISGVMNELHEPENYCEIVPYQDSKSILEALKKISSSSTIYPYPKEWISLFSLKEVGNQYAKKLIK